MAINGDGRQSGRRIKSGLNVEIFTVGSVQIVDTYHRTRSAGFQSFGVACRTNVSDCSSRCPSVCVRGVRTHVAYTIPLCPGGIMASGIINETSATNLGQGESNATQARHRSKYHTSCKSIFSHSYSRINAYDLTLREQQLSTSDQCAFERDKRKNRKRLILNSLLSSFTSFFLECTEIFLFDNRILSCILTFLSTHRNLQLIKTD